MTRYETIKNMDFNEFVDFCYDKLSCEGCVGCENAEGCKDGHIKWLMESEDNDICKKLKTNIQEFFDNLSIEEFEKMATEDGIFDIKPCSQDGYEMKLEIKKLQKEIKKLQK